MGHGIPCSFAWEKKEKSCLNYRFPKPHLRGSDLNLKWSLSICILASTPRPSPQLTPFHTAPTEKPWELRTPVLVHYNQESRFNDRFSRWSWVLVFGAYLGIKPSHFTCMSWLCYRYPKTFLMFYLTWIVESWICCISFSNISGLCLEPNP